MLKASQSVLFLNTANMITTANAKTMALQPISDEELAENARMMQMEALGFSRREKISTREFKEKRLEFVPLAHIQRRVDEAGTEENRAASGVRSNLTAWSTAHRTLRGDGTADEDLRDVNEGESIVSFGARRRPVFSCMTPHYNSLPMLAFAYTYSSDNSRHGSNPSRKITIG